MSILIISEKPSAARKIADALSGGRARTLGKGKVKHLEFVLDGKTVRVAAAVGHIYGIKQSVPGAGYPVFDIEWGPSHEIQKGSDYTKDYLSVLKALCKEAVEVVNACDLDTEGCLPGSELILVRAGQTTKLMQMAELVGDVFDRYPVQRWNEFEFVEPADYWTLGFSEADFKQGWVPIRKVMRRPGDGSLLEITLRRGRKIQVSKNHPLLALASDGIESLRADRVTGGTFLPVSSNFFLADAVRELDLIDAFKHKRGYYVYGWKRVLDVMPAEIASLTGVKRKTAIGWRFADCMPLEVYLKLERDASLRKHLKIGVKRSKTRCSAKIPLDEDFDRLIGYYLAEGCVDTSGFVGFYFGPSEEHYANEVLTILKRLVGTNGKKRYRFISNDYGSGYSYEVGTKSRVLSVLFSELFRLGKNSHKKTVPGVFFSFPKEFRKGLVQGYIRGDGSLFTDRRDDLPHISAGSVSESLIRRMRLLLFSLGIGSSVVSAEKVHFLHIGTKKDIETFLRQIEPIEGVFLRTPFSTKDLQSALPNIVLNESSVVNAHNFRHNKRSQLSSVVEFTPLAKKIVQGDVQFDEVVSVREIPHSGDLYDLETETHNFMHGDGVFSHNSLIGFKVIQFNAAGKKSSRMKFSTLTSAELKKAFETRGPLDVSMAQAGEARHELDWLWGINASRALMAAIKKAGIFRILSVGRVQGPALHVLAQREREIAAFKSEPYWQLFAHLGEAEFEHVHGKFFVQGDADAAFGRSSKDGTVKKVEANKVKQKPPFPFDLTTLQMEAYRCFNFSPTQTLQFAQDLYSDALVSYPRTSSQQLPPQLGLERIVAQMAQQPQYQSLASQLVEQKRFTPNDGPKEDPAHPAIHPTGERPTQIGAQQAKLYDLIVKRFLATLAPSALRIRMNVILHLGQEDYAAQGARTVEPGWHAFYAPYTKVEEVTLPPLEEGKPVTVDKLEKIQKETQPPKRYTAVSIIKALEAKNLGTKSTRASIVQTLFDRNYLAGKSIEVTPLGLQVESALEKNVPGILSEDMTRQFEEEMDAIEKQKITKEKVVQDGRTELEKILRQFKEKEGPIGQELVSALRQTQSAANVLGPCKACGKMLAIRKSQYGFFVGCTGYPACKMLYPLPKEALVKPLGKICVSCGTPQVSVHRKGKRSFSMCLDPKCKTKENWGPKPASAVGLTTSSGAAPASFVPSALSSPSAAPSSAALTAAPPKTTPSVFIRQSSTTASTPRSSSSTAASSVPSSGTLVARALPKKRRAPPKKPSTPAEPRIDYGD